MHNVRFRIFLIFLITLLLLPFFHISLAQINKEVFEVSYFVDPSRQLLIDKVGNQDSLFKPWKSHVPDEIKRIPGNIWIKVILNEPTKDYVYELNSNFLYC